MSQEMIHKFKFMKSHIPVDKINNCLLANLSGILTISNEEAAKKRYYLGYEFKKYYGREL